MPYYKIIELGIACKITCKFYRLELTCNGNINIVHINRLEHR